MSYIDAPGKKKKIFTNWGNGHNIPVSGHNIMRSRYKALLQDVSPPGVGERKGNYIHAE